MYECVCDFVITLSMVQLVKLSLIEGTSSVLLSMLIQ